MNIKADSTLLLNNFSYFNSIVQKVYEKQYTAGKNTGETFELKAGEYSFLIIQNAVYHKYLIDYYTDKHHTMYKEQMKWKTINKLKKYKMNVYLTNEYIHFDKNNIEKIKLKDIVEIEISNQFIILYSVKKVKSVLYTNSLEISIEMAVLIDMLSKVKLQDDIAGKSMNFSYKRKEKK